MGAKAAFAGSESGALAAESAAAAVGAVGAEATLRSATIVAPFAATDALAIAGAAAAVSSKSLRVKLT
jgi:hypothetical protein